MKKGIVFFLIVLTSCGIPYCRKSHLSEEELKWVEAYNVKDTIIFYMVLLVIGLRMVVF